MREGGGLRHRAHSIPRDPALLAEVVVFSILCVHEEPEEAGRYAGGGR